MVVNRFLNVAADSHAPDGWDKQRGLTWPPSVLVTKQGASLLNKAYLWAKKQYEVFRVCWLSSRCTLAVHKRGISSF
jgi:hypothetical protein